MTKKRTESCGCEYPVCTRIGDRVISRKPKGNGLVRVERFCDCLICGPHSYECEIAPSHISGKLVRELFQQPFRKLGEAVNTNRKF